MQAAELRRGLEEARLTAEAMQDRAESAEEASAAARAELARQSATNRTLLSKLASSRVMLMGSVQIQAVTQALAMLREGRGVPEACKAVGSTC